MAYIYTCIDIERISNSEIIKNDIKELEEYNKIEDKGIVSQKKNILTYTRNSVNYKLIFEKYLDDEIDEPIYFLREYVDGTGYKWKKTYNQIKNKTYSSVSRATIEKAKKQYFASIEKINNKIPLSNKYKWYNGFGTNFNFNVFETKSWISFFVKGDLEGRKSDFYRLIRDILNKTVNIEVFNANLNIKIASNNVIFIIYIKNKKPSITLLGGGVLEQKDEICETILKEQEFYQLKAYEINPKDINEKNYDFWRKNIQSTGSAANLALQKEQLDLLESNKPPVFINGQAGSGKSVMLYYLISDLIINREITDNQDEKILFLTENVTLSKHSSEQIEKLLLNNPKFEIFERNEIININKSIFFPFNYFLKNKLLNQDERGKYLDDKFINFNSFKKLYQKECYLPEKKNYTAEAVWYVITTYIEGYYVDKILTPDIFKNLPSKTIESSKISKSDYEKIYKIWQQFYQKYTHEEFKDYKGYWDRIGIVKKLLKERKTFKQKYAFIFCDEAQDFSRVEIQLILKLSIYSDFDLSNADLVPIFFAGDPFQTVKPTGFSFENLKFMFYEELTNKMLRLKNKNIIETLYYNYRSRNEIVNLANIIQFFRKEFLNTDIEKPQLSTFKFNEDRIPVFYDINSSEQIKNELKTNYVYLIPNDLESEEELNEFQTSNSWFSKNNPNKNFNIKTVKSVKGSEYERVILFGFGNYFINKDYSLQKILTKREKSFELSYFFNKLYVAITRARTQIVILDTKIAENEFWKVLLENPTILDRLQNNENWYFANDYNETEFNIKLNAINFSGRKSGIPKFNKNEALTIANEDKEIGIYYHAPDKLRDAAKGYSFHGEDDKANECKALAAEIEKDYEKAASYYLLYNQYNKALDCYFIAGSWELILKYETKDKAEYSRFQTIAHFVVNKFYNSLNLVIQSIYDLSNNIKFKNKIYWLDEVYEQIGDEIKKTINSFDKSRINTLINNLLKLNEPFLYGIIAELFYKVDDYKNTIFYSELAQKNNSTKNYFNNNYYKAKYEIEGSAIEQIYALGHRKNNDNVLIDSKLIIEIYEKNYLKNLEKDILEVIFNSYLIEKHFTKALVIYNNSFDFNYVSYDFENNLNFLKQVFNFIDTKGNTTILDVNFFNHLLLTLKNDSQLKNTVQLYAKQSIELLDKKYQEFILLTIKLIAYSDFKEFSSDYILLIDKFKKNIFLNKEKNIYDYHIFFAAYNKVVANEIPIFKTYKEVLTEQESDNKEIEDFKFILYKFVINKFDKKKHFVKRFSEKYDIKTDFDNIEKFPNLKECNRKKAKIFITESQRWQKFKTEVINFLYEKHKNTQKDEEFFFLQNIEDNNQNEINIKFWQGEDFDRQANILFTIRENHTCYLTLTARSSDKIASFFAKLVKQLNGYKRIVKVGKEINVWHREFSQDNNFVDNINRFIEKDKKLLDILLDFSLLDRYDKKSLDGVRFIAENEFLEHQKRFEINVNKEQQKQEAKGVLRLKSIELKNIKRYKDIKIKLNEKVTCIIAENGLGKSTILSSIALALAGVDANSIIDAAIVTDLLRIEKYKNKEKYYSKNGFIKLEYSKGETFINQINFSFIDKLRGVNVTDSLLEEKSFVLNTGKTGDYFTDLIVGFPQGQVRFDELVKLKSPERPNIVDIYSLITSKIDDRLSSFSKWVGSLYPEKKEVVNNVFTIISKVVSEKNNIDEMQLLNVVRNKDDVAILIVKTKEAPNGIPMELLSQGLTNIFTWIGYFMGRIYQAFPNVEKVSEVNAILIIDEIDKYLHPKWQNKILKVLLEEFKNTQFIITTHSPIVLSGLEREQVAWIKTDEKGDSFVEYNEDFNIWGWEYQDILERWMLRYDPYNEYNLTEEEEKLEKLIENKANKKQIDDLTDKIIRIKESRDAIDELKEVKNRILEYEQKLKKALGIT